MPPATPARSCREYKRTIECRGWRHFCNRPTLQMALKMYKLSLITLLTLFLLGREPSSLMGAQANSVAERDNPDSQVCLERIGQLDKCLPKLVVYGDRKFEPPKTEAQLDKHCNSLDENLKCVSSYSRQCLPAFARNIYSIMTKRLKTQFAKRCKSKEGRRDFINLMACGDQQYMEPAHRCMDSFVAHLERINGLEAADNQNRQIELVCCTFQLFQECIFDASKRIQCPHRLVSSEKAIDYVRSVINSMGGDLMDFMCGRYDKVSACLQGYPKIMAELKGISEKVLNGTSKPHHNSPLRPMLQLFINFQRS